MTRGETRHHTVHPLSDLCPSAYGKWGKVDARSHYVCNFPKLTLIAVHRAAIVTYKCRSICNYDVNCSRCMSNTTGYWYIVGCLYNTHWYDVRVWYVSSLPNINFTTCLMNRGLKCRFTINYVVYMYMILLAWRRCRSSDKTRVARACRKPYYVSDTRVSPWKPYVERF